MLEIMAILIPSLKQKVNFSNLGVSEPTFSVYCEVKIKYIINFNIFSNRAAFFQFFNCFY